RGLAECLAQGGTGYFTVRSDQSTLIEDISLVRPTLLGTVPRICDVLIEHYHREFERLHDIEDPTERATTAQSNTREKLRGGRVIRATVGTAPLSAEMAALVQACVGVQLDDSYGTTETNKVLVNNRVQRPPVIAYKLVDVPELGYRTTDVPHP